ncbi:beta-ketoacyl synthase N-terminal-like domain-containing protein [Streptacidiphilus sp. EB129]|uniref:beta-ketoacyl synthase N-terminal-like domain-containing protein n=1 Tax=Streptacidiphilus sp. EB129 TaxID=3156262 RepID=UPI003514E1BE
MTTNSPTTPPNQPTPPTSTTPDALRGRLKDSLGTIRTLRARVNELERPQPLAVVGMSCRLPGGASPEEFWQSLVDGRSAPVDFPADRHPTEGYYHPDPDHAGTAYTLSGNFLDAPVDGFDPTVFGISPREAAGMDPQQRLILELAWEAMEDAGLPPTSMEGTRTGVFLGASTSDYVRMRQQEAPIEDVDAYQLIGEPSFLAGRISYTFGFQGPSMVTDTACSSSLVALEQACLSLRSGGSDVALVGGVNLMLSPYGFVLVSKLRALSPDGLCKTFDASADGYARGEGGALFVLKRLRDAEAAGDRILALVRGVATEHDGRSSGLTVPNPTAQQGVIRSALKDAGIAPADLTYVEAHGTGTQLGDPIELQALDAVTTVGRPAGRPLLVGSVKTNIGHLEPAAGAAGLLKAVLALGHDTIPRHLHLENPNPQVPWADLNLTVTTAATPWPAGPRVAGVSSFGASGTNAHVIVSEAPKPSAREGLPRTVHLLTLSANTAEALRAAASCYLEPVQAADDRALSDIAYSTHIGRARLRFGLSVVGDRDRIAAGLAAHAAGERSDHAQPHAPAGSKARRLGWLFTGQGSQYAGMAAGLAESEPVFAQALQEAVDALDPLLAEPLGPVLAGRTDADRINRTGLTQPALFAVEYALARLWESWGVQPTAVLGHSLGEITAACVAGVHSLADTARLIAARARLMEALPTGGVMETLVCDEASVRAAMAAAGPLTQVSVAAVNGPTDVVLSGAEAEVAAVVAILAGQGVKHRRLVVSHAFHSPLMAPMLDDYRAAIKDLAFQAPRYRLISNVTGKEWGQEQLRPEYWVEHVASAVRFADGIAELHAQGCRTFLELGPAPILLGLGARCLPDDSITWVPSLRRDREDPQVVAQALGALHHRGVPVDWEQVHLAEAPRRTSLPSYPWQRERYWFADSTQGGRPMPPDSSPAAMFDGHLLSGPPTWTPDLAALADEFVQTGPDGVRSVSPGGFCNWALTGAAHLPGAQPRLIDRFLVGEPLLLDQDQQPKVRVYVMPQDDDGRSLFLCYSLPGGEIREGDSWRLHARGVLSRRPADAEPEQGRLAEIRQRCVPVGPEEITVPVWAEPVLTEVHQGPGEVLAEVNGLAESLPRGALLDLTLHLLRQSSDAWESGMPVPANVRPLPARGTRRYIHGWLDPVEEDGELRGGLEILGADGTVLIAMRNVRVHDPEAVVEPAPRQPVEQTVWDMEWQPGPELSGAGRLTGERLLVIGGGSGPRGDVAAELGEELTAQDAVVEWAEATPEAALEALSGAGFDHVLLLSALEWPTDHVEAGSVDRARHTAEHVFLAVARQLANDEAATRLWVVTRGAQCTGRDQRELCLPAGPLWGLGKVAALEHPDLWGGLLDLDPSGEADEAAQIAAFLTAGGPEDLVALRDRRPLVPRLVPATLGEELGVPELTDLGSYLVTGGLGSLGLVVGEWLARNGAGTVVLAGRSGLPERSGWEDRTLDPGVRARIAGVRRIEAHGAEVRVAALDTADEIALTGLVTELERAGRPLRGVVHAAGLSEPQFLREADPATYDQAMHAKAAGTWALHRATLDQNLDLFVSFSSIASVWGSQHLAGYSAANAYLDSIGQYRQLLGLPATTVAWGPWGVKSGLADDSVMAFLRSIGLYQLNPDQALELLGDAIASGVPNRTVCAADWPMFRDLMEARRERPILREIRVRPAAREDQQSGPASALTAQLLAMDEAGRQSTLDEYVRAQLSAIMRLELDVLTEDTRLADLGLDSLMVMELISRCREDLSLEISSREFFACPGIEWGSFLHRLVMQQLDSMSGNPADSPALA